MTREECIKETKEHIAKVEGYMNTMADTLKIRGECHDNSKLKSPELEIFTEYTSKLKDSTYGSLEYNGFLKEMKVALDHHYKENQHHPEWAVRNGIIKDEKWRDIVGFEGYYEVSNWGRVKAVARTVKREVAGDINKAEKILKAHITPKGYRRLQLSMNGVYKNILIHRAVAQAFIPNPDNKNITNHKNSIRTDNYVDNLEWMTDSENQLHSYENGFRDVGYIVHCVDLDITTMGAGAMERELRTRGFNISDSGILLALQDETGETTCSDLHFICYKIEEQDIPKRSMISHMTLIDIVEMLCDWKAASERHANGDIKRSIEINRDRFNLPDDLVQMLLNTVNIL